MPARAGRKQRIKKKKKQETRDKTQSGFRMAFLPKTYENKRVVAISVVLLEPPARRLIGFGEIDVRPRRIQIPWIGGLNGWDRRPGKGLRKGLFENLGGGEMGGGLICRIRVQNIRDETQKGRDLWEEGVDIFAIVFIGLGLANVAIL